MSKPVIALAAAVAASVLVPLAPARAIAQESGGEPAQKKERERIIVDKAKIVFDDGDTFAVDGREIRVLGVDTPETIHEDHGIMIDQEGGPEAREFTKKTLEAATEIVVMVSHKDRYGRTLGHVLVDGELLAIKIIEAGHGYETISHYGDNGFPEYAEKILAAAEKAEKKPTFEKPWNWRRKNQKRAPRGERKPREKDGEKGEGEGSKGEDGEKSPDE